MALTLSKYVQIAGLIHCRTGLRIGGSKDEIEIGGMDNPIIRHPISKMPYIPGSSLKGKIRSLLEYKTGKVTDNGQPCGCLKADCLVCTMFGPHLQRRVLDHNLGPTRLLFRDCAVTDGAKEKLMQMSADMGLQFAEVKTENIINRKTGMAADRGLRTQERVPEGTEFEFSVNLRLFKGDNEEAMINFIQDGINLLTADYLGSSGSRGYGQIEFRELKSKTLFKLG